MPELRDQRPLGVFGGTFDPVHLGHLRLAEEAADALDLDRVRWIPAGKPAFPDKAPIDAGQRLEMVRRAIGDNPRFELDDAEVLADQPSFTVPTLERLRQDNVCGKSRPLVLLLGADAFAGLARWHRWQDLFALTHIAIAHRPSYEIDTSHWPALLADAFSARYAADVGVLQSAPAGYVVQFAMTPLDISATKIRQLLSNQSSVRYLLPDALINYIDQHQLYPESSKSNDCKSD